MPQLSMKKPEWNGSISLTVDDFVPTSMVLALAYPFVTDPQGFAQAIQTGLEAFPHLTGKLDGDWMAMDCRIVPSTEPPQVEFETMDEVLGLSQLQSLSASEILKRFGPSVARDIDLSQFAEGLPLFAARLTNLPRVPMSIVILMVSHIAIDGTGLAMFLNYGIAGSTGEKARHRVIHDRSVLRNALLQSVANSETGDPTLPVESIRLPSHYSAFDLANLAEMMQGWESTMSQSTAYWTIGVENIDLFESHGISPTRTGVSALLSHWLAEYNPVYQELALWCNTRGLLGIPKTYTGNTGCYLHLPLALMTPAEIERSLHGVVTPKGFAEISDTYRALKQAEQSGILPIWNGMRPEVLPLNMVTYPRMSSDVAGIPPSFAKMLTRNLHGLRTAGTPDGKGVMVEATLPDAEKEMLVQRCKQWGILASIAS